MKKSLEEQVREENERQAWIDAAHQVMRQLDDELPGGFWFVSIIEKLNQANPQMPVKEIHRMLDNFMPKSHAEWKKYVEET